MSTKPQRRCVFCARPGSSREDVFAEWISEVFPGTGTFSMQRSAGRDKTGSRHMGLITRAACRLCNNGWMSVSEKKAKPLLAPVMQGRSATWSTTDRETVARWAFKTALMIDRSTAHVRHRVVPADHFHHLYKQQVPPQGAAVDLLHYEPTDATDLSTSLSGSERMHSNGNAIGYRVTFNVASLVFVVAAVNDGTQILLPPTDGTAERLWPLQRFTFTWPPPVGIDTTALRALVPAALTPPGG
jgi:hypothetical protein